LKYKLARKPDDIGLVFCHPTRASALAG